MRRAALAEGLFVDGHFTVLSSGSMGGAGFTPESISTAISEGGREGVEKVMRAGACIPIFIDADCEFGSGTLVVVGDLNEQESKEWVGRMTWKLKIPDGRFLIVPGGGAPDYWEGAINEEEGSEHFSMKVDPGDYQVDVYAYVGSLIVNNEWDGRKGVEKWFKSSHPGAAVPDWVKSFESDGYAPGDDLVSYIIRLSPLQQEPPFPELVEEVEWCGVFEMRELKDCPKGLMTADYESAEGAGA